MLLFGLCPLELLYSRWTFLDNLVTPWLLLAFVLAYSPRRSIGAATGSALAFGMAVLTKETALLLLPALAWAFAQNLDRRNRAQVIAVAASCGLLLMALYPLYALYKGELVETPGRNTLLGTAKWQLLERQASGSLLDAHSATSATFAGWLAHDRVLLLAGAVAIPLALLVRRLRPVTLALVMGWLVLFRGGYLPFMHVLTLLPWSALIAVGVVERLRGNWRLAGRRRPYSGWRSRRSGVVVGRVVAAAAAVAMVATVATRVPSLHRMTTVRAEPPLHSATRWVADNVPRDRVLVVHDAIWTDLVQKYGYDPRPIIVYKLDTDPAVRRSLRRIDYIVLPNWYFRTPDSESKYPTAVEAHKHAVVVATFGTGDDGVTVYRVSSRWRPT